jgi:outer membrane protein TolC
MLTPALAAAVSLLAGAAPSRCSGVDLPRALALAASRSDEVAIRALERATAQTDLALARAARFFPSASATVITGPVPAAHGTVVQAREGTSNRNLDDLGPFVRFDANIIQPLWTWGQLDAARDAAEAGVAAREALMADTVSQVQLRVARLFWGHVLAKRLVTIAGNVERNLAEVDKRLKDALDKNEASVGPNDTYRVQVLRAELARRAADARKALALSQIGLAATLVMDTGELELADVSLPAQGGEVPPAPPLIDKAESLRPDLVALSHAAEARRAQLRATQAAKWPQIFLGGTLSFAYAPNRDLQTNPWVNDPFREVTAGIVLGVRQDLTLHILDTQAQKARSELAVLERQQDGLRRLVRAQVEGAQVEATAARERLDASTGGAAAAKSWFRAVELNFGVGVEDAKSLMDSYSSYVESQVNLATAQYDWVVSHAQLDQATGAPLAGEAGACPP